MMSNLRYLIMLFVVLILFTEGHRRGRNIFIDLGTNDGESVLSFVKGAASNITANDGSNALEGGFQELIKGHYTNGTSNTDWHIIAVEAFEGHTERLERMRNELLENKNVSSMKLYTSTAISTKNGFINFIWDSKETASAGATTMQESYSAVGKHVKVPCLDIVTLIKNEKISVRDFVVMKVDIEGAEYELVRRILLTNLWQYIDRLAVEWHHNAYFVFGHPGGNTTEPLYQERLDRHLKYAKLFDGIMWMVEGLDNKWTIHNWG